MSVADYFPYCIRRGSGHLRWESFGRTFLTWENWAPFSSRRGGEVRKSWHSSKVLPALVQDCREIASSREVRQRQGPYVEPTGEMH
jgi:hypothetical protein